MLLEDFASLKRGDKIFFIKKPNQIWDVDHPADVHDKKCWKMLGDNLSEQTPGGGGDCISTNGCITISISTPIGRGQKRLTQVINDYSSWSKL